MSEENILEADGKKIDLAKITRIYPAVLIHAGGESASVSLEWAELKADQIRVETYLLVCDFDPVGEVPINRIELRYPTKEALMVDLQRIARQLSTKN